MHVFGSSNKDAPAQKLVFEATSFRIWQAAARELDQVVTNPEKEVGNRQTIQRGIGVNHFDTCNSAQPTHALIEKLYKVVAIYNPGNVMLQPNSDPTQYIDDVL